MSPDTVHRYINEYVFFSIKMNSNPCPRCDSDAEIDQIYQELFRDTHGRFEIKIPQKKISKKVSLHLLKQV